MPGCTTKGANQEAKLRYMVHNVVDLDSGVILETGATQATSWAERAAAEAMMPQVLSLLPPQRNRKLFADAGYQAEEFLAAMLALGLQPVVPMTRLEPEPLPAWKKHVANFVRRRQSPKAAALFEVPAVVLLLGHLLMAAFGRLLNRTRNPTWSPA